MQVIKVTVRVPRPHPEGIRCLTVGRRGTYCVRLRHAGRVEDGNTLIQTPVQLTVSPVLYAIALRPEDPGQLRAAVSLACRWWGGLRFPWLPVGQNGAVTGGAENLCEVLDVAGIIDLTRPDGKEPVPTGLASLGLPVAPPARWLRLGLPVRGAVAPTTQAPLVTAVEADGDGFDPVPLLGLGYLNEAERAAWEEAGQQVSTATAGHSLLPQLGERTAVSVTATAVDDFVSTDAFGVSAGLVWLLPDEFTLPQVAEDLAGFWNYRALRLRHQGTVTVLARMSSMRAEEARSLLAEAVSATALSTPTCVFNGLAVGEKDLRDTAEALGFRILPVTEEWTERRYQPEEPLELTAVVNQPLAQWWMKDRFTGASTDSMAITGRPRWQARIQSPLPWRYPEALGGPISARIASPVITGPRTDSVAALYQPRGRWRDGGVRFTTHAVSDYRLDIGMPQPADVLAAALAGAGLAFAPSDKGREIDGVLATSRDLALFRQPAFHAVTAAMTPPPSPRIERALERFADRIEADPEMATAAQELRDITAWARAKPMTLREIASHPAVHEQALSRTDVSSVLADMVARSLVRWGYERRCSLCGLNELVPLTDAAAVPQCAGCGRDAAYAIRDGEPELHYALSSLLQRVSRNAGLAPLAATAAFRQQGYYLIPGADISQGGQSRETDLLGWHGYRLLAGEAKAAASWFTADGIADDLEWAASIGATTYALICPQPLPLSLVEDAVKAASEHGLELLQLTGPALTSGRPPENAVFQVAAAETAGRVAAAGPATTPDRGHDPPAPPDGLLLAHPSPMEAIGTERATPG